MLMYASSAGSASEAGAIAYFHAVSSSFVQEKEAPSEVMSDTTIAPVGFKQSDSSSTVTSSR